MPIKLFDKKLSEEVIKITKKLIEKFTYVEFDKLNQAIYKLYKLSKDEVEVIEDLYSKIKFQK